MSYKRREGKTTHVSADTLQTVSKGRCLIKGFVDNLRSKVSHNLLTQNTSNTQGTGIRDESFGFTTIGRTVANNNERRTRIVS